MSHGTFEWKGITHHRPGPRRPSTELEKRALRAVGLDDLDKEEEAGLTAGNPGSGAQRGTFQGAGGGRGNDRRVRGGKTAGNRGSGGAGSKENTAAGSKENTRPPFPAAAAAGNKENTRPLFPQRQLREIRRTPDPLFPQRQLREIRRTPDPLPAAAAAGSKRESVVYWY